MATLRDCDVTILAGGLGTRIRSVLGDTPKLLAPIGNLTLLDILLARLAEQGAARVVLALGRGADAVTAHLQKVSPPLEIVVAVEPEPLGTAGALRHIRPLLHSEVVVAMNGDTLVDLDLNLLPMRLAESGASAVLACVEVENTARFGRVKVSADEFVEGFAEKGHPGPGAISAGVYGLAPAFFERLAASPGSSLENDFLQTAPPRSLAVVRTTGRFVDIGTPEGLAEGVRLFDPVNRPGFAGRPYTETLLR
jgi:NDP-sugar pyrophosphorylase family protein